MIDPASQREFARSVLQRLREAGFEAYWAGGCVRDQLLDRTPKDYDIATGATPQQVQALFGKRRTLAIGAAFGVIAVIGIPQAGTIEVTTFRTDAAYSDGRHPDSVRYSTAAEDAQRRDFTINGLFYDPENDRILDFVGGQDDLRAGVIRAIGDPLERITEDKLRMLRGVRFAASFGFQLEPRTAAAIRQMQTQIVVVSPERIAQEMRALLTTPQRVRGLELLRETGLLETLLPEAAAMCGLPQHKPVDPDGDLWSHTLRVLGLLRAPTFTLAMGALLHDIGKPKTAKLTVSKQNGGRHTFHDHETVGAVIAGEVCRRWKLSRREENRICWLVKFHMYLGVARTMRWAKLQRMLTAEGINELLDLHEADALASTGDTSHIDYCRELLTQPPEQLNPAPLITGHDLIRHGVPQGKLYHGLLERVYDAQLERQVRTKREALALVDQLVSAGLETTGLENASLEGETSTDEAAESTNTPEST